jgi:dTDP-4-dehydrorhamnose 3,5-epimerase
LGPHFIQQLANGLNDLQVCFLIIERGFFLESYNKEVFQQTGIGQEFVQDNHSKSTQGVVRGLHYQKKFPQGKLI